MSLVSLESWVTEEVKSVTFSLPGDLDVTLSIAEGDVKVDVAGIDVDSQPGDHFAARVWGFMSASQARELAHYLNELADKIEGGTK